VTTDQMLPDDHLAELVAEFYDTAITYVNESFNQIKQRVLKGRDWPSEIFAQQARSQFDLARRYPDEIDSN
jgi:proline dehydrogenase